MRGCELTVENVIRSETIHEACIKARENSQCNMLFLHKGKIFHYWNFLAASGLFTWMTY